VLVRLIMQYDRISGNSLPDASIDTFDLDLVEFDKQGNDNSVNDISSFYEYLETVADEPARKELVDTAVLAATFPDESGHSSAEPGACRDNQTGYPGSGEELSADRPTFETVRSSGIVDRGGGKFLRGLSLEELIQNSLSKATAGPSIGKRMLSVLTS